MSRPWMPFYVRDHLADTVHLSAFEQGVYLLLIMYYWLHKGLPTADEKLARIVRLSFDQWMEIRPIIVEFFEHDWRHKRIEAELAVANEKYQRRAEAGRRGGRVSGQTRQRRTNAEAMLQHEASNAEAGPNQPQPQAQAQAHKKEIQSGAHAPDVVSDEDRFWARLKGLEVKGIGRTDCKKLLKLSDNDFMKANRVLDKAEQADRPKAYLGGVFRNLQEGSRAPPPDSNPQVPTWISDKRAAGVPVERDGKHWRCQGRVWTDSGEELG
ncbi:YdaU family protein [Microvirga arabica]|uniref:YdaU family protein n=1 Tax=Microvirga arabica TaxID=1128671 RepID=UPI00193A28A5|nr:DUF1376 domain-containing protein [Microvirga arabica]MBM1169913.1 DUF1376 domain-containing protein [Microvirga arabica]